MTTGRNPQNNKSYFNNIGLPTNVPSMFNEQGGLSDAGIPAPFTIRGRGPLDSQGLHEIGMELAKRRVQESVNRFDSYSPEQRIAARKRTKKDHPWYSSDDADELDRKEIRRLEREKKEERRKADEAYNAAVEERSKDEGFGKVGKHILNVFTGDEDGIISDYFSWIEDQRRNLLDATGLLGDQRSKSWASTLGGEITSENDKINRANAYKETLNLLQLKETLLNDRDKYITPAAQREPEKYQELLDFYNNLISQIDEKINDPVRKQLTNLYKVDYIKEHTDTNWKFWTWFDDIIGSTKIETGTASEKEQRRQERLNERFYNILSENLSGTGKLDPYALNPVAQAVGNIMPDREKDSQAINYKYNIQTEEADSYIARKNKRIQGLQEDYIEALKLNDRINQAFDITQEYKDNTKVFQDAPMTSLGYWFYSVPGLIGSSNSSPSQIKGTAIEYGGALAAMGLAPVSGGLSTAVFFGSGIAATPFLFQGGKDENRAELMEKKTSNMLQLLQDPSIAGFDANNRIITDLFHKAIFELKSRDLSDDFIKTRYTDGKELSAENISDEGIRNLLQDYATGVVKSNDPILRNINFLSSKGLQALYEANNMRTVGDLVAQKALMYSPFGLVIKGGKGFVLNQAERLENRLLAKNLATKVEAKAAGRVTATVAENKAAETATKAAQKYSNGFRKRTMTETFNRGFEAGASAAAASGHGIVATTAAGLAGGIGNVSARLAKSALPASKRAIIDKFAERAANKYQLIYDKMAFGKEWPKLAAQYGVRATRNAVLGGLSEGSEEAVQYLNSLEDYATKYGFSGANLGDLIINDIAQGNKVADAYFSYLGIGDSPLLNDAEFRENWKGGFVLGAGHVGSILGIGNIYRGVRGFVDDLNSIDIVDSQSMISREHGKIDRASYKTFAQAAMNKKTDSVIRVLDNMESQDRRRKNPEYTQEEYDQQKQAASSINGLVNDKNIRKDLEKKGIVFGTEEYATAIADLYQLESSRQDTNREIGQNTRDLATIYNSKSFLDKLNTRVSHYLSDSLQGKRMKYESRKEIAQQARQNEILRAKKDGQDVESAEFKAHLDLVEKEAFDAADSLVDDIVRNSILNMTRVANKLHGLLKVKAQQNTIEDWYNAVKQFTGLSPMRPDAKVIRDDIERQISQAKEDLHKLSPSFNADMSDANVLEWLETNPDIIKEDQDNAREIESALAMLSAQNSVTNSYLNTFSQDDDRYSKRIKAIIKANNENERLDWMINDIFAGDDVTKLYEAFKKEDLEAAREKAKRDKEVKEKLERERNIAPMTEDESEPDVQKKINDAKRHLNRNRAEYNLRKEKARQAYERRKNKYNKSRRGRLSATIPFEGVFVNAANILIRSGETAVYKFSQFVEDVKDIVQDIDISDVLPILKQLYIKAIAKYQIKNPQILDNLSSVDDVLGFQILKDAAVLKLYLAPTTSDVSPIALVNKIIQELTEKIIQSISSHYHTVVNDNGEIKIYQHKSALLLDKENELKLSLIEEITRQLESANTSDEAFKQKLEELTKELVGFPVDDYVTYRNVEGIIPVIATNSVTWGGSESIQVGNIVAQIVEGVFTGSSELPSIGQPSEYELFLSQMRDMKQKIESLGYTLAATNVVLYGETEEGDLVTIPLDILFMNENTGRVYAIDVRTSYLSISQGWNNSISERRGILTTIGQDITNQLHQIEDILSFGKYNLFVERMGVLPVVATGFRSNHLKLDNPIIPIQTKYEQKEEEYKDLIDKCEQIVDNINSKIDEYNMLVQKLVESGSNEYAEQQKMQFVEQDDEDSYKSYMETLVHHFDTVNELVNDVSSRLVDLIDQEEFIWHSAMSQTPPVDINQNLYDRLLILEEACSELDALMSEVPVKVEMTDVDKADVRKLYQAILDAQTALDDYLQSDRDNDMDITAEAGLIASAMEKLAENKEVFGAMSVFVQQWWLTNFSESPDTNTNRFSKVEFFTKNLFYDKIKMWVDTLYDHVLGNLYKHPKLQQWYSTLFNNYFQKLVDNFLIFLNEHPTADDTSASSTLISIARELIQAFNESYNVAPDPNLPADATELDKIRSISTQWKDHYGVTDSHSPAYMDMAKGGRGAYVWMSQQPDFITSYKTQDANIESDPNHATRFILYLKDGKVKLEILYWDKQNNKKRFCHLGFENDIQAARQNPNVSQELLDWLVHYNLSSVRFTTKAKQLIEYVSKHPEYKITFNVSTNKGSILYDENRMPHNVFEWVFTGQNNAKDGYTIKLSRKNRLGVAKVVLDPSTGQKFYDVFSGEDLEQRIGGVDEIFRKQNSSITSGLLVYFYNTGNGQEIAIPIVPSSIGDDAKLLVSLMQQYARGARVDRAGFDILELLKMRLYFVDKTKTKSQYNKVHNSIFSFEGSKIKIGNDEYDVFEQEADLIKRLSLISNVTDANALNENMAFSSNPIFSTARRILKPGETRRLSNGLRLSYDDFSHQNADGSVGSTWLGYLMRNGMLFTTAIGTGYKLINISGLDAVKKESESAPKVGVDNSMREQRRRSSNASVINKAKSLGLAMEVDVSKIDFDRSKEDRDAFDEAARKFLQKVLGTSEYVELEALIPRGVGRMAVGLTTSTGISLSTLAPYSAIYHEAFHKVLELMLPSDVREKYYKIYRAQYGTDLSERLVAEGMADLFVDYSENVQDWLKTFKRVKGLSKLAMLYKPIATFINMAWHLGFRNTKTFIDLYKQVHRGDFAKNDVTQDNIDRFVKKFNGVLFYTVNGVELKEVEDSSLVRSVIDALEYAVLEDKGLLDLGSNIDFDMSNPDDLVNSLSNETIKELTGEGVPEEELLQSDRIFREILLSEKKPIKDKGGNITGFKKIYPKFKAIAKDLLEAIRTRISDYSGKIQDLPEDEDEDEKVQKLNIDKYDRASYEFRKLDSTTKNAKMFFGTIPYMIEDEETGKPILDLSRNEFSLPTLMPMMEVYNTVVNDLHNIKSHFELAEELNKRAKESPMYRQIAEKFNNLIRQIYKYDGNGNIIDIDYDKESYAVQIAQAVSSQKVNFVIAKSIKTPSGKNVYIKNSSEDRDSKSFPRQWWSNLVSGSTQVFETTLSADGSHVLKPQYALGNNLDIFSRTALFFTEMRTAFSNQANEFTYNGQPFNKLSYNDMELIKLAMVSRFNQLGIMISKDAFDYMLRRKYGNSSADGIGKFLTNAEKYTSLVTFTTLLNSIVDYSGKLNQSAMKSGFSSSGFVAELATYEGAYRRITTDQRALALNGKTYYTITQNNTISYISDQLSTGDKENRLIRRLTGFSYVYDKLHKGGSIIARSILSGTAPSLLTRTYIGFRTDNFGDSGNEYSETTPVEDYMAKAAMLQKGWLVPPTLADKGTYMVIEGLHIPGITYRTTGKQGQESWFIENIPTVRAIGGKLCVVPSTDVINQFIEYAYSERLAIQECMEDLGYDKIDGYEKQGRPVLKENQKIKNYHTPNKDKATGKVVEPSGTRFLSLTEIAVVENGEVVTYNLNNPNESSNDLLKLANEKFFSKDAQTLADIITLTLLKRLDDAILFAVDNGIVSRTSLRDESSMQVEIDKDGTKVLRGKEVVKATDKSLLNLSSRHLNQHLVEIIADHIFNSFDAYKKSTGRKKDFYKAGCKSLAIAVILSDITNKSIISSEEFLRCYIGHPGMFKVDYDFKNGKIKDSTYDIQKRIGGMVSTGDDNILDLPGMPKEYTCAECKDYEVGSTSDIARHLDEMFYNGAVREAYAIAAERNGDKDAWQKAYSADVKELVDELNPSIKQAIQKAIKNAAIFADAYKSKINVADGAAYITADMCRNLLRMRGAYDGKVKEAFDLLTGDQSISWMSKREAYSVIYDAVNIVTTKYTAYGFRDHTVNGDKVSSIAVPYYNKYALFPLFDCTATGPMARIYQKMKREGVDMMMMESAVKLGSQGAVKYDGELIGEPFNIYTQDFGFLRRQLNTDPEEGDTIAAGTQMVKIALANLRLKRENYNFNGQNISGKDLLKIYMDSIKELSKIGVSELNDMFYTNGELDPVKLSKYLQSLLTSRNANKALIEAIQLNEKKDDLVAPLAATPDSNWIESIIISTVNKKVIDITTPGSSFVQRSVFATESTRKDGEGKIVGDDKLQMINEKGSMDAKISIDYFNYILPKIPMSFEEKRQWLIKNKIIGKEAEAVTVGYRIPTQAQSSIHALRFIDVIPAEKSSIILPEEFTKITGSDFDIDHLYLISYNFKEGEDGLLTHVFDKDQNAKEYHENTILDVVMCLLQDVEYSTNSLYKSIDNDTDLAKSVADQIPEEESSKAGAYNFGTLHEQVMRKDDYITGKKGIGPFALNITNLILTYLYGVRFKTTEFALSTNIYRLDNLVDDNYNSIQSWIGAFINGHVDIVKDKWVTKLNVNPFTYSTLNLLLRSGFGENALWFIAQPVIRDMAKVAVLAKSQFLRDPFVDGSVWKVKQRLIKLVLSKYMREEEYSNDVISNFTSTLKSTELIRINQVNYIKDNIEALKYIATHPGVQSFTIGEKAYDTNDVLKNIFYTWKTLERYSLAMDSLVQHTKIDTRKHGKTMLEIYRYLMQYNKLFHLSEKLKEVSIWDNDSLSNLIENSWIELKTKDAILAPFRILKGQTFNCRLEFISLVYDIAKRLSTDEDFILVDFLQTIGRHISTRIKSKYIIDYAHNQLNMSNEDINNLFTGNFNMYTRLNGLKYSVLYNEKYTRLKDNKLINQLTLTSEPEVIYIGSEEVRPPSFITVKDNVDGSKINSNDLIDGWEDLLNDQDPHVRKFAKELVVYAFLTSGEFKGWNKLFKYVPPSFLRGEIDRRLLGEDGKNFTSFTDFVRQELLFDGYTDALKSQICDEVVQNNSGDIRFAMRVEDQSADPVSGLKVNNFVAKNRMIAILRGMSEDELDNAPTYISANNSSESSRSRSNRNLYKYAGCLSAPLGKTILYYPVYVRMPHKGYHNKNNDIYEYGWTFEYRENGIYDDRHFNYRKAFKRARKYIQENLYADAGFEQYADDALKYIMYEETENAVAPNDVFFFDDETMQNVYQNWKYLEDSTNTTPISDIVSEDNAVTQFMGVAIEDRDFGRRIYNVVKDILSTIDRESKRMVSIPYAEYKNVVSKIDRFDYIRDSMVLENYYEEKEVYGVYDSNSNTQSLDEDVYKIYKILSENQDVVDFMTSLIDKYAGRHYRVTAEDTVMDIIDGIVDISGDNVDRRITSYSELDLFLDTATGDADLNNPLLLESNKSNGKLYNEDC